MTPEDEWILSIFLVPFGDWGFFRTPTMHANCCHQEEKDVGQLDLGKFVVFYGFWPFFGSFWPLLVIFAESYIMPKK